MSTLFHESGSEDERKPAAKQAADSSQPTRSVAQPNESSHEGAMQHPPDDFEPIPFWNEPPSNQYRMYPAAASGWESQEESHAYVVDPQLVGLPPRQYSSSTRSSMAAMPSQRASVPTPGGEGSSWEKRFAELLEFKSRHGHCEVPQNYKENTSLGIWVNKQRMEQKLRMEGKNSSLNDARLQRLESVGFRWAKRKGQVSWNEKFEELKAYKREHGNVSLNICLLSMFK
jgi:hypothetical protein